MGKLWGIDLAKFPAHLSTINLVIRDLSDEQNYPNIVWNDFFKVEGPRTEVNIGVQRTIHEFGIEKDEAASLTTQSLGDDVIQRTLPRIGAVVGNPPYTRQEEMYDAVFGKSYKKNIEMVIRSDFPGKTLPSRASIYAHFFAHGLRFLEQDGGRLGFVSLRSWLDVDYGQSLGDIFLNETKLICIVESQTERWFPDAQMLPCVTILERCKDKNKREANEVHFVQLKSRLSDFIPTITDENDMVQEINRWQKVDAFVDQIEHPEQHFIFEELAFLDRKIKFYEDDKLRILSINQMELKGDPKWGKYLSAPSVLFKLINKAKTKVTRLDKIASVRRGYTTGANEFFILPNKNFDISQKGGFINLLDKRNGRNVYRIESKYLRPVMSKIKPYKSIANLSPDTKLLLVSPSKGVLSLSNQEVVNYLQFGETYQHSVGARTYKGYHEHQTCKDRKSPTREWYDLGMRAKYGIFSPSIFWGTHRVFFPDKKLLATDCLDEIDSHEPRLNKALCALMNSTFQALIYELNGRYVENRDKTISNEIKIYELEGMPVINPTALSPKTVAKLENAFDKLCKRDIGFVWEEVVKVDRKRLDRIVFSDILKLSEKEADEIKEATSKLFKQRVTRGNNQESEGEE